MGITLDSIKERMLGKTFGTLTIKKYVGRSEYGDNLWECLCTCGKTIVKRTASVDKPTPHVGVANVNLLQRLLIDVRILSGKSLVNSQS